MYLNFYLVFKLKKSKYYFKLIKIILYYSCLHNGILSTKFRWFLDAATRN